MATPEAAREDAARFVFRHLHPRLHVGTASDRYAAWIGQVYSERWRDEIQSRTKKLGTGTFEERLLPIACVEEYFTHFSVLEIDFTYYRPLCKPDGSPDAPWFVLSEYLQHAPEDARFVLKVPQTFFARIVRRTQGGKAVFVPNTEYLNTSAYLTQFHIPAANLLGHRLAGLIFEQEFNRPADTPPSRDVIRSLDAFFSALPQNVQAHLELRSPHLLTPDYYAFLRDRGLGAVFSHWTWLPPIREQWKRAGGQFSAANQTAITRILTPMGVKFEDAFARAYPFDKPLPDLEASPDTHRMVLDATALAFQAFMQDTDLFLILNNRAYGNAPTLAQRIAMRIIDEFERRAQKAG